jgi:hypothetical protein
VSQKWMTKDEPEYGTEAGRDYVLKAIEHARRCCCGYVGGLCDCKYGHPFSSKGPGSRGSSEQTGCPEMYDLADVIRAITPHEWARITKRLRPKPNKRKTYAHESDRALES